MGVYFFEEPKSNLDKALELLKEYPNSYANVEFLRMMIEKLR